MPTLKYVALVKKQRGDSYLFVEITGHYTNDKKVSIVFKSIEGVILKAEEHEHKNWPGYEGQKKYIAFDPTV